jgi:hypothetical protein
MTNCDSADMGDEDEEGRAHGVLYLEALLFPVVM